MTTRTQGCEQWRRVGANSESCSLSLCVCSCPLSVSEAVLVVSEMSVQCPRGSCYGIHRINAMLMSLQVATISRQVRHFNCKGLHQLQHCL